MSCLQSILDNDFDVALLPEDEPGPEVTYMDIDPISTLDKPLIDFEAGSPDTYDLRDEYDEICTSLTVSSTVIKDLSGLAFTLTPALKGSPVIKSSPPILKPALVASRPLGLSQVKRKKRDHTSSPGLNNIPLDHHSNVCHHREKKKEDVLIDFGEESEDRSVSSYNHANKVDTSRTDRKGLSNRANKIDKATSSGSFSSDSHPRRKKANTNTYRPPALRRTSEVAMNRSAGSSRYSRDRDYYTSRDQDVRRSSEKKEEDINNWRVVSNWHRGRSSASAARDICPKESKFDFRSIRSKHGNLSRTLHPSETKSLPAPLSISSAILPHSMSAGIASDKSIVEVINTRPYKVANTNANREFLLSVGRSPAPPFREVLVGKKKNTTGRVLGGPSLFKKTKDGKPVWMSAYGLERERECMEALVQKDPEVVKILETLKEKELREAWGANLGGDPERNGGRWGTSGRKGKEKKSDYRHNGEMVIEARKRLQGGHEQDTRFTGNHHDNRHSRKGDRRSERNGYRNRDYELDY